MMKFMLMLGGAFQIICGGLVAPKYGPNPWNYKFTWNPRNVVLAGQGTAQFIKMVSINTFIVV